MSWDDVMALSGGDILNQTYSGTPYGQYERPVQNFDGYSNVARTNGVVYACMKVRRDLFSEARFQWRRFSQGRPGDLFGDPELAVIERPDTNMTTGNLIARMEQDATLAGNSYHVRIPGPGDKDRLVRLQPNWVTIVMGSPNKTDNPEADPDSVIAGYLYAPYGGAEMENARVFTPEQMCHFAPEPDPLARHRGMSWLTPILREIDADTKASDFKTQFFNHSATPNMVITYDKDTKKEALEHAIRLFEENYTGSMNAFKTMHVTGGADAKVVGNNFEQMAFKAVQAAGETRIAAASGVPPVIVGLSEGLGAATYSNYGQARRALADRTARPWWREAAASLESVLKVPGGAHLWYDDRDIPFLRDDAMDVANIAQTHALTIKLLQEAGWDPDTCVQAVMSGDYSLLEGNHTGLMSVQLRPQGIENVASPDASLTSGAATDAVPPKGNGQSNGNKPALTP